MVKEKEYKMDICIKWQSIEIINEMMFFVNIKNWHGDCIIKGKSKIGGK